MKNMKPMNGVVIVRVKHTMNDRTESGLYKDISFDRHGKMAINGEVMHVSDKGSDHVEFELYQGQPRARDYDGAFIDDQYIRNYQVKHDIQVGDIVYFHYLTLEDPHNYLRYEDGYHYFRLKTHDCFLSIRPDAFASIRVDAFGGYKRNGVPVRAVMHNQYVLGKEYWGEGWEEVEVDGKKIAAKSSNVGSLTLVTETKEDPLENHAVVTDIGVGIDPYSRHPVIIPGDIVLLKPQCEFENEIEHQKRWVFTHMDIIARKCPIVKDTWRACADYVMIQVDKPEYESTIYVPDEYLDLPNTGKVLSCGHLVNHGLIGVDDHVMFFKNRAEKTLDRYKVLVRQEDIMAKL